nr:MAG TPA: hypothetical protein [Caudoviricetes sp.]
MQDIGGFELRTTCLKNGIPQGWQEAQKSSNS